MTKRLNMVRTEFLFETNRILTLKIEFILHKSNNNV